MNGQPDRKKKHNASDEMFGASSIDIETVTLKTWHAMTINAPNTKGIFLLDRGLYYKLIQSLYKPIKGLKFVFVMEISSTGRYHIHGKILFKSYLSVISFYETLYRLNCNYKFKRIEEADKWEEYMAKQQPYIQAMCDFHKVDYFLNNDTVITSRKPLDFSKPNLDRFMEDKEESTDGEEDKE